MNTAFPRRRFIQKMSVLPMVASGIVPISTGNPAKAMFSPFPAKLRLSLNCYSFNTPLRSGEIDLFDVLRFCASHGIDAIDPTGYYFPGYPEVPTEDYISRFKRQAFLMGIDISGTGVRNDFTISDPEKRKNEVELVKNWIEAAARLGAPTLRIFVGVTNPEAEGFARDQVFEWMVHDIRKCCDHAKKFGVVLCLQNHWDYIKTASDILKIFKMVNSEWLGLNLDIGSFRHDPFEEISKTIHLAVTWQIKENIYVNGQEQNTDYEKLFKIIYNSGYRGYLPLETLGAGDPFEKLPRMIAEVRLSLVKAKAKN